MGASINELDAYCRASEMMSLCIFLILLYKICHVLAVNPSSVIQESGIKTAKVGEDVTLKCLCQDDAVTFLSWYQQSLGGKPEIISTRMKHDPNANIYPKYKNRFRVLVESQNMEYLKIANLSLSDSGTYYCGVLVFNAIEFGRGVFLHVKTSVTNVGFAIDQPTLKPLHLGESLNLNCTVEAEPCAGELNLYWFRHGASQSAVMYPSEGHTCTSTSKETPHRENCTLNLAIKSVSSSDAGIYYCALASCGEVIFGNGTRVKIIGSTKVPPVLVYCLSVALAVSIIVLLVLAFIMYKHRKKLCSVCKGTVSHQTRSAVSDAASQDADRLHYAALNLKRSTKQHRQEENVDSDCVYSKVKSRKV